MKKIFFLLVLTPLFFIACNNSGKDSVEKADSANKANMDTAINNNMVTIDDASSDFLVRVANSGIAETTITSYAQQHASLQAVKDYAGMLYNDHTGLNNTVKDLAAQKNVVLPAAMSDDKQKDIDGLEKMTGKNFDKAFIDAMIKNHEASIDMFEKALLDAKDNDVRAFADKTLPVLKGHLATAKELLGKYW